MEDTVQLHVYDLSQGMARQLSPMLLGQQIDGIWHTAVVIRGLEYFFGMGIQISRAGTTPFGAPVQILELGTTSIPTDIIDELLFDLGNGQFRAQDYNLIYNNCNHFSHQLSQLLTGQGIPDHIVQQGERVLNSPMGQMLRPMLMQMEGQLGNMTAAAASGGAARAAPAAASAQTASAPTPSPAAAPSAAAMSGSSPVIITASASTASLSASPPPSSEQPGTSTTTTAVTTTVVMTAASEEKGAAQAISSGLEQPLQHLSLEEVSAPAPNDMQQ